MLRLGEWGGREGVARGKGVKACREGWKGRGGEREGCEGLARGMDGKGWREGRV